MPHSEVPHPSGSRSGLPQSRREARSKTSARGAATSALPRPALKALAGAGLVAVLGITFSVVWPGLSSSDSISVGADVGAAADSTQWGASDPRAVDGISRDYDRENLLEADPVTFTVTVDGEELEITTTAPTLSQALLREGIVVGWDDEVSAPMSLRPDEGAHISIVRHESSLVTTTEELPFETIRTETSALPQGTERVETEGVNGVRTITYRATAKDGTEVTRQVLTEVVDTEPVAQVVLVGTAAPANTSAGSSSDSNGSTPSSSDSGEPVVQTYTGEHPKAIAQRKVTERGWSQDQWVCLERLWQRESNWNYRAANPRSSARGIPQAMMTVHFGGFNTARAQEYLNNPAVQIDWGLNYISGRYGTPCGAWAQSQRVGWY